MRQIDHHLAIDDGVIVCRRCGHELAPADENFKSGAVMKERPIEQANPLIVDPRTFIDDWVVFRQYYCPGCAALLENEVVLASTPPVWDKQLAVQTADAAARVPAAAEGRR